MKVRFLPWPWDSLYDNNMPPAEINLLRSKTRFSPEMTVLLGQLRKISYFIMLAVLIIGVVLGGFYFYLQLNLTTLINQKSQLLSQVNVSARKETLYRSVKAELGVATKVLSTQKKWGGIVGTILGLGTPPTISSFSVEDTGKLSININTVTIEDAANLAGSVIALVQQNKLKDPVLENLEVDKNGHVRMLISFTPILL